jgi:hypothetical protein
LFCFVLMSLWNSLVPALFDGPAITFGQALALFVLSRILLLPVRAWWGWRLERRRRSGYFRKRFEEKLAQMTPKNGNGSGASTPTAAATAGTAKLPAKKPGCRPRPQNP